MNPGNKGAIQSMAWNFPIGHHEFHGSVALNMFNDKSAAADRKRKYYSLVVEAVCANPADPSYAFRNLLYFEFSTATAKVRLI